MSGQLGARRRNDEPRRVKNDDCPTPDKIGYQARRDARKALEGLRHKHARAGSKLRVYRCACGAFHLGNAPVEVRRDAVPIAVSLPVCAKRHSQGHCAFPVVEHVRIGGGLVALCELHVGELRAAVARRTVAA